MEDKKIIEAAQKELDVDKEIFTAKEDEEVINCEGSPCSFEYPEIDKK